MLMFAMRISVGLCDTLFKQGRTEWASGGLLKRELLALLAHKGC